VKSEDAPLTQGSRRAAAELARAWRHGARLEGLPTTGSREDAYLVQDEMARLLGLRVAGWKVGAASPGVMKEKGIDAPIPGRIFAGTLSESPAEISASRLPQTNLESEFAFRVGRDFGPGRQYSRDEAGEDCTLHAAFDLTGSRYVNGPADLFEEIADNGNAGAVVVGSGREIPALDLERVLIDLRINSGAGVANLNGENRRDPVGVLLWTINSLSERGHALEAGSYVLTGSVTQPQPLELGDEAVARFEGIGGVRVRLVK